MASRRARVVAVCVLFVGVLSTGCKRANGRPPEGATVPIEAPTTTTEAATATTLSYEVPAVIDEAYVERVMAALDQVLGDAIRVLGKNRKITEEFLHHLTAIYTEDEFELHLGVFVEEGRQDGFASRTPTVGNPRTDVLRLLEATARCILAEVHRDYSATVTGEALPSAKSFVSLVPKSAGRDHRQLNPTPWAMAFDREFSGEPEPEDWCPD